jgi:hypothetical protein
MLTNKYRFSSYNPLTTHVFQNLELRVEDDVRLTFDLEIRRMESEALFLCTSSEPTVTLQTIRCSAFAINSFTLVGLRATSPFLALAYVARKSTF